MDDVSDLSSCIRLKSQPDAQIQQPWDDDSGFWDDPATLRAIEELTIAEAKEAADVAQREKSQRTGPPATNLLRDNGRRSGGKCASSSSSSRMMVATLSRQSQPAQSQGIHASCRTVT